MPPLFSAMLLAFCPLLAQAAPPVTPGAGTLLQQIQPPAPPPAPTSTPALKIEGNAGAERSMASAPFMVNRIDIQGNTVFDMATLRALIAPAEGKKMTVDELTAQAGLITEYYRSHGYPLARAVLPAQSIRDGVVRIQVINALYGSTKLVNQSKVSASLMQSTFSPLQSGGIIHQQQLDSALMLLSDIPGVLIDATLTPGASVAGTADLLVNATPGPVMSGDVVLDNYGNDYTGRARIGGTANVINPLHHGDVLSATVLSSGKGMNYGRLGYESLINGQGSRLGASYSALRYVLGKSLAPLDAHGTAGVSSLWVKHPWLRGQERNLYGSMQVDYLELRDHIDASAIRTDRHASTFTASLYGDVRDRFAGLTVWNAGWMGGRIGFDNASAELADAATATTRGAFSKVNLNLSRMQNLTTRDNLYLSFTGQWSDTNLDASQKITAGGVYTVRAYDMGAVSGDTGYMGTAEWRHDLRLAADGPGKWQAVAFVDHAHLTVNKAPWLAGANGVTLSGFGAGVNWALMQQWNARLYVTRRFGSTPDLLANSASTRAWIELNRAFSH
jgi:hemolysin activation/secretion protein